MTVDSFSIGKIVAKGIELGSELNCKRAIMKMYEEGFTQECIAKEFSIASTYNCKSSVATVAIHYAIAGYDGRYKWISTKAYTGLIENDEERLKLSKEHSVRHLVSRPPEQMRADSLKGVRTKGQIPWSNAEVRDAYLLSKKYSGRGRWKKITAALTYLHGTDRSSKGIDAKLRSAENNLEERLSAYDS